MMAHSLAQLHLVITTILLVKTSCTLPEAEGRCLPVQFEADLFGNVAQFVQGNMRAFDIVSTLSFDATIGKQAGIEHVYSAQKLIGVFKYVRSKNVTYVANLSAKKCAKAPGIPVTKICTNDPGLKYITSWRAATQMTDTYYIGTGAGAVSTITFVRDPFTAVSQTVQQNEGLAPGLSTLQYGNTTLGIVDPSVFDVPEYCKSVKTLISDHLEDSPPLLMPFSP